MIYIIYSIICIIYVTHNDILVNDGLHIRRWSYNIIYCVYNTYVTYIYILYLYIYIYAQTLDHLIFQCKTLKNEREILKNSVLKVGNWPVCKSELTNRNLKQLDT